MLGANPFQAADEPSDYLFTLKRFLSSGRVVDQSVEMIDRVIVHIYIHVYIHAFVLEWAYKF